MSQVEITLSGVGGQGLILAGTLMAKAAAIYDNKNATLSSEYGVETRGTFAKSDLIISDEEIFFTKIEKANYLLCLHQIAYNKYVETLDDTVILIYNSDQVSPINNKFKKSYGLAIDTIAKQLGDKNLANIYSLGVLTAISDVISLDSLKLEIREYFSSKSEKRMLKNFEALDLGYKDGKDLL